MLGLCGDAIKLRPAATGLIERNGRQFRSVQFSSVQSGTYFMFTAMSRMRSSSFSRCCLALLSSCRRSIICRSSFRDVSVHNYSVAWQATRHIMCTTTVAVLPLQTLEAHPAQQRHILHSSDRGQKGLLLFGINVRCMMRHVGKGRAWKRTTAESRPWVPVHDFLRETRTSHVVKQG